ncbi:hypothetical protein VOLCADRAFT_88347 [Volvox carteri f. nagariensis]|uniref:Ribonuclease M5 C-terminal domain-containing protein n=1 Tax=Volvox carteri f. nagariensis TaxID=3068 RepID=D8TN45_VOLCA|nr:uncharacterized protein VOLCADRAFT_88347 [Volvox carteri f. nagariensis]EFJ50926.1 hypothetical protein VOLCADRAFT_88347 [Volvox carteri f. nagariensis]|eukprot:XP_002947938.1 hypothetical protein VOLCADRAFT_88347 [Volvox carteri f. nagariensis]
MGWELGGWEGLPLPAEESGKEVPSILKAEEEIAKFTVDEHLSDVERTVLYLNGGHLIQQRHAIANLPAVLKGRGRPAFDAISQPLKAALNRLDSEAQIATAEAFATIARERLLSPVDLQVCILPTVTRNINREKSEEETDAWLNTLFELIPLMDKEVLKTEVLSLALSKGDVEGVVGSKTICVRILGALAPRLTWEEIERTFFKKALSMCQDVDHHIRIASCGQLSSIARIAGRDVVAKTILPELFELLNDEEVQARVASLTTLTTILDLVPTEVRKGQVMPILRNHMQPLELDIAMQRCLARMFGQLVTVIKADFEHDDSVLFFSCFKHLATKSDVELRRLCAGQLPAVLRAATALSTTAFAQQFQDTLISLATDPDVDVRKTVAAQLHEVARVVGKDCPAQLTRPLCRLLRDEVSAVPAALLPTLPQCLGHWLIRDDTRRDTAIGELAKALLELEASMRRNWRMQQQLATAFPIFPQARVFSSDQIYEQFLPITFRYLTETAAAVRPVAAEGLVCFLRYNRREKQRADIMLRIVREFCRGRSFVARITFVDIAAALLRRFSSRFIKEYIFDLVLELLYDPVPNVRLSVTSLLPALKSCIKLPEDVDLLERLNSGMSNIMTDNDRDVSQNARSTNEQFKKTPMRMGGAGGGMLDMNGNMGSLSAPGIGFGLGSPSPSIENEDRRKEDEESDFTFSQDDTKDIKGEILQVGPMKGKGALSPLAGKNSVQRRPGSLTPLGRVCRGPVPASPPQQRQHLTAGIQRFRHLGKQRPAPACHHDTIVTFSIAHHWHGEAGLDALIIVEGFNDCIAVHRSVRSPVYVLSGGYALAEEMKPELRYVAGLAASGQLPSQVVVFTDPDWQGRMFRTYLDDIFRQPALPAADQSLVAAAPLKGMKPGKGLIVRHAFLRVEQGTSEVASRYHDAGNVGVEHASPEVIRTSLVRARPGFLPGRTEFSVEQLRADGLIGSWDDKQQVAGPQLRRGRFCRALGIDEVGTGKGLVNLLNRFFTREEYEAALKVAVSEDP